MTQMLLLAAGGEEFPLDLNCVRELLAFEGVTPVPAVPGWFAGLVVVRGELIAAVDFAILLGRQPIALSAVTRVVVLGGEAAADGRVVLAGKVLLEDKRIYA